MKQKIICMGVISLLLLMGVTVFSVGAKESDAGYVPNKAVEQKSPVAKSEANQYKIKVWGGSYIHVLVLPQKGAQECYFEISIYRNENYVGGVGPSTIGSGLGNRFFFTRSLNQYWPEVGDPTSYKGTIKVKIVVGDQMVEKTGRFFRILCWFDK